MHQQFHIDDRKTASSHVLQQLETCYSITVSNSTGLIQKHRYRLISASSEGKHHAAHLDVTGKKVQKPTVQHTLNEALILATCSCHYTEGDPRLARFSQS